MGTDRHAPNGTAGEPEQLGGRAYPAGSGRAEQIEADAERARERVVELEGERVAIQTELERKSTGRDQVRQTAEAIQAAITEPQPGAGGPGGGATTTLTAAGAAAGHGAGTDRRPGEPPPPDGGVREQSKALQKQAEKARSQLREIRESREEQSETIRTMSEARLGLEAGRVQADGRHGRRIRSC